MVYGASNLSESLFEISYGLDGDPYTAALNPIRDTIFFGNQTAYDFWGQTSTTMSGLLIPVNAGINAATKAGSSIGRAVAVELGKSTLAAGSSFFPKDWTPQKIVDSINEAYINKEFIKGNTYVGESSSGVVVKMFLNEQGEIISAFPVY